MVCYQYTTSGMCGEYIDISHLLIYNIINVCAQPGRRQTAQGVHRDPRILRASRLLRPQHRGRGMGLQRQGRDPAHQRRNALLGHHPRSSRSHRRLLHGKRDRVAPGARRSMDHAGVQHHRCGADRRQLRQGVQPLPVVHVADDRTERCADPPVRPRVPRGHLGPPKMVRRIGSI